MVIELVHDKNEAISAPLQEGHRDLRPHPKLPQTICVLLGRMLAFSVFLFPFKESQVVTREALTVNWTQPKIPREAILAEEFPRSD